MRSSDEVGTIAFCPDGAGGTNVVRVDLVGGDAGMGLKSLGGRGGGGDGSGLGLARIGTRIAAVPAYRVGAFLLFYRLVGQALALAPVHCRQLVGGTSPKGLG